MEYKKMPLSENVEEMFIGPFGSSLKNECFVAREHAYCMVYEQKHAIQKTMNVETRYIDEKKYKELQRFNIKGGDIIVSCRGTIGETFVVPEDAPLGIMHPSIMKIRLKDGVYDRYYFNSLLKMRLKKHEAEANGSGIKMAISATELGKELFPVPSLAEQERIKELLSGVEALICKRKEELQLLDNLIKARFVELFGTPLLNEKEWGVKNTGDVCSVTDGSHFSPAGKEEGYPMLSVRNMRNDGFHYDDCKLVSQEDYDILVKQGCKPLKNDVLIAKDGSYFYYGFVVKEEIEQAVLSSIAILRPNLELINPEYLCRYMLSSEIVDLVGKNYVTGAAIKRVILKGIKQIPVMLPPIELQNQFAAFVEQIDKSKVAVQKALDEAQLLFDSLMQKYFG